MQLNANQRKIANQIIGVGNRLGATPKAIKAALEAGIVESNLGNPNYGDRDSLGTFQQRASWGPASERLNVVKSAEKFYARAMPLHGKYGSAGQLAQAVQVSTFPGRYQQQSGAADSLLRGRGGSTAPQSAPVPGGGTVPTGLVGDPGSAGTAISDLLAQQLQRPAVQSSGPALPAFAARAPVAGPSPSSGGMLPASRPSIDSLIAAVQSQVASAPSGSSQNASEPQQPRAAVGGTGGGAPTGGKVRTVAFDGKPVRSDFAHQLAWARAHGWQGTVTSGFRTKAQQMAAAKRYGLQHYGPAGPLGSNHVVGHSGAVDVTDAEQLNKILGRYPGKRTLVWGGPVIGDTPHFSLTGH